MEKLVIGVPAYEEDRTIVALAEALEVGSALLGESVRCELVLAYQAGQDQTLQRWETRSFRIANRVLHSPEGETGKGRNVKRLVTHALEMGAHLLLVDADLAHYSPSNVARFVRAGTLAGGGIVLPLWCRPRGEGNSTDFVACPLLFARFGALVRQPLAGQMLLTSALLTSLDLDRLPDHYGIDVALTVHALEQGLPVAQVATLFPEHEGGSNSHTIMGDVFSTLVTGWTGTRSRSRADVAWPEAWWADHPVPAPSGRNLERLLEEVMAPEELRDWTALLDGPPDGVRDMWCERLVGAVGAARAGHPADQVAADLAKPFLVHAARRRRAEVDQAEGERYLIELCERVASAIR